jgi:presenilin-like A22 family membrane protease
MKRKLQNFLPFALPVLGGLLGVIWVNLITKDFLHPVLWIGLGAIAGWAVSRLLQRFVFRGL